MACGVVLVFGDPFAVYAAQDDGGHAILRSVRRGKLRTRVLLLTGAFVVALFAISFGLSWRARLAQERWTRLISVETKAVAALEELVRAQNGFYARFVAGQESPDQIGRASCRERV